MGTYICKICKNNVGNQPIVAPELMLGTLDKFVYFKCSHCGCLQIAEMPEDMSKYYPPDKYYSFNSQSANLLQKPLVRLFVRAYFKKIIPEFSRHFAPLKKLQLRPRVWFSLIKKQNKNSAILDVGCGDGFILQYLNTLGYKKLLGVDPFIKQDISYPNGVKILKNNVFDISEKFDLIMMHHSFEHIDAPLEVLKKCHDLLNDKGTMLIRIPVSDCYAFRKYGVYWFQLDAPRHLYLHSVRSMSMLAKESGFKIKRIIYDSTNSQIINSETNTFSYQIQQTFVQKVYRYFEAKRLNLLNDGDQACFLMVKQ